MTKETELHFSNIPSIDISRCKLPKKFDHKTTFNTGDIIPIFLDDLLPGSTVKMRMSEVVRMMTPIAPVMDNAYLDVMFYFVPHRLVWSHWPNFMGENDTAPWVMPSNYEVPQITFPAGGWDAGSLADYFGLPTGVNGADGIKVSALPFRSYCKIYNDWFRDENLKNPVYFSTGDSDTTGKNYDSSTYDYVTDTECGAKPLKAAKFHDYFTSALPSAQRGQAINVPLGNEAPIVFSDGAGQNPTIAGNRVGSTKADTASHGYINAIDENEQVVAGFSSTSGNYLIADLSQAVGATVNQLRQAFAVQKFYERAARAGSRYIETIRAHFRTTVPDFRLQRSEYLGGKRVPVNMNQVVQTDASGKASYWDPDSGAAGEWITEDKTPQGNLAAYSATADTNEDMFTYSCCEHGYIMGVAVIRTDHSYQQGINQMWSRKKMFDYYWPELANLGEMPILNKEIYASGTASDDEAAFGYQEAWASYRYKPNMITGELRSNYAQSLDIWHYGDDYSQLPTLSSAWIDEPEENMARTLAVQSHNQFFGDFYFAPIYTLPMPLYSVPGLIDHH